MLMAETAETAVVAWGRSWGAHGKAGNGNGHGTRKRTWKTETTFTRSVFCANFWFMTELDAELDACMCAVVCDKLMWTVLCAVG